MRMVLSLQQKVSEITTLTSQVIIEQIGMRGVPTVGMSYCAVQGALVVGNKHMTVHG